MSNEAKFEEIFTEAAALDEKLSAIEERYEEEQLKLFGKYELEKASLYKERAAILGKIDNFWSILLEYTSASGDLLLPSEHEVLSCLVDISVERDAAEPANFKIIYKFSENEFFTDAEITKEYKLVDGKYTTSKAAISWKQGKSLVVKEDDAEMDDDEEGMMLGFFTWLESEEDKLQAGLQFANEIYPNAVSIFQTTLHDEDDDESDLDEEDIEESEDEEKAQASKKRKK
ncbi:hypothetical protein THASP1DRAFT_27698 [Thamnocephalis sphaerospora]|uniref:Nucleosome assembly protein n=1 Tax=Thamnocephalis sphaerospora TaxID=78915 RepID=A0A4P9XW36_9FUNG|nr:hypothetical protein THASP1DRAFT_27698 [Thamnocephalis sphaerospora]|eukprot:RKP10514.1 hypothetical protein THASP1DRAFT_27698 [Thamnocephalis sphaerospora]